MGKPTVTLPGVEVEVVVTPHPAAAIVDEWVKEAIAAMKDRGLDHEFFADFRARADALKTRLGAWRKE
jgi:hypothetical protein